MRSSAAKIKHWFHVNKDQPIHVRVLVGYYSAGWRDEHVEVADGETPLTWARLFRARCLWETLKAEPFAQRRRQGWAQRSQGQKLAWEDMMVRHKGLFWRCTRDSQGKTGWIESRDDFIGNACAEAGVPTAGYRFRMGRPEEVLDNQCSKKAQIILQVTDPKLRKLALLRQHL